jgi:hypothetical protein
MILTENQIYELLTIIQKNQASFVATSFGQDFLNDYDKTILDKYAIDWTKSYDISKDIVFSSFSFGMLAQAILNQEKIKGIDYKDLKEYISSGKYIPLTQIEKSTINSIKNQSLKDIKTLNSKIFNDVNQSLIDSSLEAQQNFLRKEIIDSSVIKKLTVSQIANEIGHKTGDWSRNFDRIVQYISQTAYEQGKASLIKKYSTDDSIIKVYKKVYQGACKHCIRLYLTNGLGSKPIIFILSELEANGNNIGRKTEDYKPTLGPLHPHCRCSLQHIRDGEEWNQEKQIFELPEKYVSKVVRKKVLVKVGSKEFYV